MALGSATFTEARTGTVKKVHIAWTSSSSGVIDTGTTTYGYDGHIELIRITPSSDAPPSANYDVYLYDADSFDVLLGGMVNLTTAITTLYSSGLGWVGNSKLTIAMAEAGNAASGTIDLWIR